MRVFASWFGTLGAAVALVAAVAMVRADEAAQAPPTAAELAARIQARQATVRDFTAKYTLSTSSPLLPREPKEQGTLTIKKPGRLRQTSDTGERNEAVADGKNLYVKFPRDRYVEIAPLPTGEGASTWSMFLTGRGDLVRDFSHQLAPEQPAGEWRLILTPRQKDASFRSLVLEVDRQTLQLRGLVVRDTQDTTSVYRFSDLRENQGLRDQDFEFVVPKGFSVRGRRAS